MWPRRVGPLPVAIALALGIALAPALDRAGAAASARWLVAAALVAAAIRWRRLVLPAVIAAGAARGAISPAEPPPGVIADDRIVDRVTGIVDGPVVRSTHGYGALVSAGGDAVWIWSDEPVRPGERIAVEGIVRTPRGSLGPALPDRADALLARGARFEVTARSLEHLADEPGPAARVWRWAASTQDRWSRAIDGAGGEPAARAALRGIAVGDRSDVPAELDARWRATGIFHVLSVSGLHLAVVAGLAFTLLRRLIAGSPWGGRVRPARWAAPPALVLAVAYTLVTGAQIATLRALIVVAIVLIAAMIERPVRPIDALGVAALAVLALRPADLFDPAFQLSFTAALVLAVRPARERRGVAGWIAHAIATSAWVTLATAPITAYHFHELAPGGVAGNLVLTPLVELIALPLSLGGLALGWDAPVRLATWLVELVDRGAGLLGAVTPVGHVVVTGAITLAVLVAISLGLAARARRTRLDVLGWVALCIAWSLGRSPPPAGALRVSFIDVGQGDAALIELPDGAVWLIDAGGAASARDLAAASASGRTIERVLAAYGHARIDLAIVSHPHPDHYLGLAALRAPIDELWSAREIEPSPERERAPEEPPARSARPERERAPEEPPARSARINSLPGFDEIARMLAERGTRRVEPPLGIAASRAGVELIVWAPRYQAVAGAPIVEAADPVRSVNDNSLVVAVRYRGRTIVFAGDVEAEGEDALVAAGLAGADVVKVAHHGSATSSSHELVAATHPALAVISCGRANRFGFPAEEVVERWQAIGADVARTDLDGTIVVTVDAAGGLAVERFAR